MMIMNIYWYGFFLATNWKSNHKQQKLFSLLQPDTVDHYVIFICTKEDNREENRN